MNTLLEILGALKLAITGQGMKQADCEEGISFVFIPELNVILQLKGPDASVLPQALPPRDSPCCYFYWCPIPTISDTAEKQRCFGALAAGDSVALTRGVHLAV